MTTSTKSAKSFHATVRRTLERMGIPFRKIVGGFKVAHEPSIRNGATVAAAIAGLPVVAHSPLNGTRKSMMEPNGEDGAIDVEGMEQERQYVSLFVLPLSRCRQLPSRRLSPAHGRITYARKVARSRSRPQIMAPIATTASTNTRSRQSCNA